MSYFEKTKQIFYELYKTGLDKKKIKEQLNLPSSTFYRWQREVEANNKPPSLKRNKKQKTDKIRDLIYERQRVNYKFILKFIKKEEIEEKINLNHSFGMILDYIKRDTDFLLESKSRDITLIEFRTLLQKDNFKVNSKEFNVQPQWWKLQYKFPKEFSKEKIEEILKTHSRNGQKITVENRKKNKTYENRPFKREWSPLCMEFYTKKGISNEKASETVKQICSSGALACLKTSHSPSTETVVYNCLIKNNIEFSIQYSLNVDSKNIVNKKRLIYDFYIPLSNLLIECNGSYWHCDPRFYKETDVVTFPEKTDYPVINIWKRDSFKIDFAHGRGYDTHVIWEFDLNNNQDETLKLLLEKICQLKKF